MNPGKSAIPRIVPARAWQPLISTWAAGGAPRSARVNEDPAHSRAASIWSRTRPTVKPPATPTMRAMTATKAVEHVTTVTGTALPRAVRPRFLFISSTTRTPRFATQYASVTVHRLAAQGLPTKSPDPDDRRGTTLTPTPQALLDRQRINARWTAALEAFLESLPPDERASLLTARIRLQKLTT